jgi:hypothetical protein
MWGKFRSWYLENYTEITWFLIGFLVMDALVQLSNRNLGGAILSSALAIVNYVLSKRS